MIEKKMKDILTRQEEVLREFDQIADSEKKSKIKLKIEKLTKLLDSFPGNKSKYIDSLGTLNVTWDVKSKFTKEAKSQLNDEAKDQYDIHHKEIKDIYNKQYYILQNDYNTLLNICKNSSKLLDSIEANLIKLNKKSLINKDNKKARASVDEKPKFLTMRKKESNIDKPTKIIRQEEFESDNLSVKIDPKTPRELKKGDTRSNLKDISTRRFKHQRVNANAINMFSDSQNSNLENNDENKKELRKTRSELTIVRKNK